MGHRPARSHRQPYLHAEEPLERNIKLAHESFQGMPRIKARLRQKVWWPNMDNQIEQFIRACHPCQLVGTSSKAEPIRSATLSEGPWADMAVDLQEIAIPGGQPSSRGSKQLLPVA